MHIERRPGRARPQIVKLPIQYPVHAPLDATAMFHRHLHAEGLDELRHPEQLAELARRAEPIEEVLEDLAVAVGRALVEVEHPTPEGAVGGFGKGFHGGWFGKTLKAKFRHEAVGPLALRLNGFAAKPHTPGVRVAGGGIVHVGAVFAGCVAAGGDCRP